MSGDDDAGFNEKSGEGVGMAAAAGEVSMCEVEPDDRRRSSMFTPLVLCNTPLSLCALSLCAS